MSRFKWFEMIWMPKFHAKLENQHKQICNSKWPRLWLKGAACAQGVGLHICMFNLNISVGFCWLTHLLSLRHGFFDFLPNVFRPINVSDHRQIAKGMTSSWAKDEPSSKESRKAKLNSWSRCIKHWDCLMLTVAWTDEYINDTPVETVWLKFPLLACDCCWPPVIHVSLLGFEAKSSTCAALQI